MAHDIIHKPSKRKTKNPKSRNVNTRHITHDRRARM